MTMPHKICPQCGQPAVLAMMQCQRCGFVYGSGTSASQSGFPPSPHSREIPRAQQPALQPRRRGPLALLVILGLGIVVLGAVALSWRLNVLTRGLSEGSGLNSAPIDAEAPPSKLSLFVESDSREEMPVLKWRNFTFSPMSITLRDRYGHVYRSSIEHGGVATLQVPAGDYSVSLDSSNPRIHPNWGDASFRKFKAYRANIVLHHSHERIHLGD
jgi:hypothetical protein